MKTVRMAVFALACGCFGRQSPATLSPSQAVRVVNLEAVRPNRGTVTGRVGTDTTVRVDALTLPQNWRSEDYCFVWSVLEPSIAVLGPQRCDRPEVNLRFRKVGATWLVVDVLETKSRKQFAKGWLQVQVRK